MNSLTVNLHLMLTSFYRPQRNRYKILIEEGAFPSDQFAVHSQIKLHGYTPAQALVHILPSSETGYLSSDDIILQIEEQGDEFALILLGNTGFRNGQVLDMKSITQAGHNKNCIVGFDLAHAVGNIELKLHDWGVDFSVWCNYKYLNGGPGSLGGCFVHERYAHEADLPRLEGWWGNRQDSRFNMNIHSSFEAEHGAQGWQLSSAPVLSMAALRASLDIFTEAKMKRLRKKSVQLGNYLQFMLHKKLVNVSESITPHKPEERACQFTLKVKADSRELQSWLHERGIVCDAQGKNVIRVSPAPLYNSFSDIHRLITNLELFFSSRLSENTGNVIRAPSVFYE
jgi:kynureninase